MKHAIHEIIQLTQQKELLEEMMKLDLMVIRQIRVSDQLMVFQIQPILMKEIKEVQKGDRRLQKFREQVEAGSRSDISIHLDGTLYFW